MGSRITVIVTARIFLIFFPLVKSICDNPQRKIMPSIIFWGLSLCSMIVRVVPTEETGVDRNRTKQPMQTIIVQSKLDFGSIESRLRSVESRISNLESEVKSGVAEVKSGMNSAVTDMKSLFAKFVGNANGGNGSLTVGGNNKTSNTIEASCYQAFGAELSSHGSIGASYGAILKGAKTWKQARKACQAIGEDLVTIASYEEQLNLRRYLKNTFPGAYIEFWIGSKKEEGNPKERFHWRWINGEPVDNNLFFGRGVRDEYKARCLTMTIWQTTEGTGRGVDFLLVDSECYYYKAYICTRKA